jgi:hypothetical protein
MNILSLLNILSLWMEYSYSVKRIFRYYLDDVADDMALWNICWWRGWWLSVNVSDDVAAFLGLNSGTILFFRQISSEPSASSTGLVSTLILMIFILSDSYRWEESPQVVKIKIRELCKFCNFEPRDEKRVFQCSSFPNALIPICCAYGIESKHK